MAVLPRRLPLRLHVTSGIWRNYPAGIRLRRILADLQELHVVFGARLLVIGLATPDSLALACRVQALGAEVALTALPGREPVEP